MSKCKCRRCMDERDEGVILIKGVKFYQRRMIVCGTCGNKRCPHATDHRNACTGSNEPGQAGSVYK